MFGYSESSGSIVFCSEASVKSKKHSSKTRNTSFSLHFWAIRTTKSFCSKTPVGLFGLHTKSISISSVIRSSRSSLGTKSSASSSSKNSVSQFAALSACSYSAKVGESSNAFLGLSANTAANITSAAPFPQKKHSLSISKYSPSACLSSVHSTSG